MLSHCKKHVQLLIGIAATAMALPFGLIAAALATTLASVSLAVWRHYSGGIPTAEDMAMTLAGGAVYLLWIRALLPTLGINA